MNQASTQNPMPIGGSRGNYYYHPLEENGPYATRLEEYFQNTAEALTTVIQMKAPGYDPSTAPNPGLSTIAGGIAGLIGNQTGFYIDNFENIKQNLDTAVDQLNHDPSAWGIMPPLDGD